MRKKLFNKNKKKKILSFTSAFFLLIGITSCDSNRISNLNSISVRDGVDGKDGSSLLTGEGAPATTLGNDGDSYIDTTTWDYYTKVSGTWTKTGNIKGQDGKDGTAASKGEDGRSVVSITKTSSEGNVDTYTITYSDNTTSTFTVTNGKDGEQGEKGNKGDDGKTPTISINDDGYWVIDGTATTIKAKGDDGSAGKDGSSLLTGEGAPATSLGNDGDSYIDTTTWDYYTKASGTWTKIGNIKGDAGKDLTAKTYTVNFYIGDTLLKSDEVTSGSKVTKPTDNEVSTAGYVVEDWKYENESWIFTGKNADRVFEDINLYAEYYYATNTYTLNANGGTCSLSTIDLTYGSSYSLPIPIRNFSTTSYLFAGWYLGNDNIETKGDTWVHYKDKFELKARWLLPKGGFGSYPQSKVTDETLISNLNSIDSTATNLPSNGNNNGWTSYNYYCGKNNGTGSYFASNSEDYMWYKDISYNNEKYRGVYFNIYRPYFCGNSSSDESISLSWQYSNGYLVNVIYWFKFEPIEWKILSNSDDDLYVISEKVLDAQHYYYLSDENKKRNRTSYDTNTSEEVYDNNYKYSDIRGWLNTDFYNTAFTSDEKMNIKTTNVDNSVATTSDIENIYSCENTNDKVFLLSYSEAIDTNYFPTDNDRQAYVTDYARCQGVSFNLGEWWTRSPDSSDSSKAYIVERYGYTRPRTDPRNDVTDTSAGVRPALHLS